MSYTSENNSLLKSILDASYFKGWSDSKFNSNVDNTHPETALELYVTPYCGQNCSYCYLQKYKDHIYPKNIRDEKNILHNLDILLDSVLNQWTKLKRIDIFSGEIVGTELCYTIWDKLLKCKRDGAGFTRITIPTNFSFILSNHTIEKIQQYIDAFKAEGVTLTLSASLDGYVIENACRSFKDTSLNVKRDQAFYDKAFSFAKHNHYGFHPMLSAPMMKHWIENFEWYVQQCRKFDLDFMDHVMMLEVRDNDWTEENIQDLEKFLWHYNEKYLINDLFNGDVNKYAALIFGYDVDGLKKADGYHNFLIIQNNPTPTCSVASNMTVRLGDLAICPCHRTAYDELIYGKFKVENDRIVGIESYNPAMACKVLMMNQLTCHHGCDVCWNKDVCIRGCFGSQYENGDEVFMPIPSICKMLKRKTKTLIEICEKYNVLDYAKAAGEVVSPVLIKKYTSLRDIVTDKNRDL